MKKNSLIYFLVFFSIFTVFAQQTIIKGSVKDAVSFEAISEVSVTIEETNQTINTDTNGVFVFSTHVPLGEHFLKISKIGYITKRYPITVNENRTVNITDMTLETDLSVSEDMFTIMLSDDELNDDSNGVDNISGLLSSSMDIFQRTAAFEFSSSFFRVRGLDSENASILINGIEMNKIFDGRPQWSNWGGLNDVVRNQELSAGLSPSAYNFGGVLGSTNMNIRASHYRAGGQITYSSSNRTYTNRAMASYATGLMNKGWSVAFMLSRRWGNQGYQDATFYDSNSFFTSIEKQFNSAHSVNITTIYAPNRRGKASPNTQEVFDLKDIKYNEYWGYQDGKKRNSRVKEVKEPIIMLNHYWNISQKTRLNTNVGYQFGEIGNSRIDYPGGANPSPTYYQDLPSDFLYDGDLAGAYEAEQTFMNKGQIDWNRLYDANITNNLMSANAAYVLYDDKTDDNQLSINSILNSEINEHIIINAAINYKKLESENYAEITDLLGSTTGVLNIDNFSNSAYNVLEPGYTAFQGDKFKYNYKLMANEISGYAQAQFKYNKIDFYLSASLAKTDYQREGLYKNGNQITVVNGVENDNSYGKGDKLDFTGVGAKAGLTYKITGKHVVDINAGYSTHAPSMRNTFTNARESHDYIGFINGIKNPDINLTEEKTTLFDASYIFRSAIVKAKLTGFYSIMKDVNEIAFFFTQGNSTGFIQEIITGANKRNIGVEFGIEAQITPTIKLKSAGSVGDYIYDNNPIFYSTSTSENFIDVQDGGDMVNTSGQTGISYLKNYKVAGGPQTAYSVGFEYRDPDYWWFGATANFFADTYVDVSPKARSDFFYKDADGLPFNDYDENIARELLKQEQFQNYMVINLVGGKSWKLSDKYVGFFASLGNLLDKEYKTGGYDQARFSDYRSLKEDVEATKRRFGPKYWYARGANYFVNVYVRF